MTVSKTIKLSKDDIKALRQVSYILKAFDSRLWSVDDITEIASGNGNELCYTGCIEVEYEKG